MTADDTTPDTAMATGNDEGEPGRPDTRPLERDERRLLEELEKSGDGTAQPAVEDAPEMAAAAADDAPLPALADGGEQGDDLTPEFTDR